jgi:hypothetical protein
MNPSDDKDAFGDVMRALCRTFAVECDASLLRGYWLGLRQFSIEQVQSAVAECIATASYFPKPVEIREKITGTEQQRSELAWSDVLRAVPLGPWKHIDFADRIINATIRQLGGWPAFLGRFSSATEEKWAKKDFERTYANLANSNVDGEICLPLKGLSEASYVPGVGLEEPIPRLIGCKRLGVSDGLSDRRDNRRLSAAGANGSGVLRIAGSSQGDA